MDHRMRVTPALILLLLICTDAHTFSPETDGPVVNQEAIEGHNTTLHCDSAVESAADELMLLVWYKNDAPIYSYDARSRSEWSSESFNTTGRLKANISQQPTTLTVSALREDDQELYHCRAALRPGSAVPAYNVSIHWVEGTLGDTLQAGKPALVQCSAHGSYPPADLAWWLDHKHLTQHSNQSFVNATGTAISFLQLTPGVADAGATLACVATNPAMAPSRGSKADIITLNVTYSPIVEVSLLGDESPNEVVELDPLHLKCDVKANPPVDRFKWYFNDNEIHAGDIWGFNTTSGELVVEEATRHHAGRYNCAAGNSVGQTTAEHISVTVFYPPECDNGITLIKETVNCNVRALPTPDTYFWHIQPSGSDMQHLTTGSALLPLSQVTGPLPGTLKVTCDAGNGIASQETPCERILSLEHLRPQQPQQCDLAYEYEEFQMRCIPVLLEKDVAISVGAVVLVAAFLISTFLVVRLARRSRAKPSAPVIQVLQLDDIARDYLDTIGENCDDCTLASSCNAINDLISSKESAASNQLKEAFCGFDNHNLPKDLTIEEAIVHPDYRRNPTFNNDIGMLRLKKPVNLTFDGQKKTSSLLINFALYDDDDQPHDDQFYDDQPYGHQIDDTNTSEPHTRQYITKRGRITSIPINVMFFKLSIKDNSLSISLKAVLDAVYPTSKFIKKICKAKVMENEETPQIITHIETNLDHSLFDCKWIPCSAKFVVIGSIPRGNGTIEIFEITSGETKKVKLIERPNAFKCGTFGASSDVERRLATGDFKGTLEIWDLEKSCQVYITKEHTDIINSIDGMGGNTSNCGAPEIVTGSRDGTVKVWDPRQRGKPVANMQPVKGETRRDCWTVNFGNSFNDAERIVTAGYDNGDLKMFDLRTMSLRWECNLKNGLENDMENYVQYKIMGSVKRIRMKPSCIPSKFVRKRKHNPTPDEKQHDSKNRAAMPSSEDSMEMSTSCFHQELLTKEDATSCTSNEKELHSHNIEFYDQAVQVQPLQKNEYCQVVQDLQSTITKIKKNPRLYIGIPAELYFIVDIISNHTKLSENNILLCLMKIRLNRTFSQLADDFDISPSQARKIFCNKIPIIGKVLMPLLKPTKATIKNNLPIPFRLKYNVVNYIIDGLEIEIQKPKNVIHQALTWSEYKNANTFKYLISCTPDGLIRFVSKGYGGRVSDIDLVEHCKFLDSLEPRSSILADRGFKHIEMYLQQRGFTLLRPPSVAVGSKLTKSETKQTTEIASLRIHVCSAEFDRKDIPMNKLVATTLEGKFHVFDVRTQNPTKGFAQVLDDSTKSGTIWVARHVPQNRDIFITCAGNGHATLWKYEYPEQRYRVDDKGVSCGVPGKLKRLQRMVISTQPINALDWNRDHLGLAIATAYDQYVRVLVTTKLNLH
ncbi:hypothetical protein MSG28_007055 [Choristoneura fumiferana]|uniref:Uncharacterized protein n=1 Tax=Choristoneura fumiferana TaxID=7141 RepID=A0ACC0JM78_CHOFU|nr:hypothetical protein MSG28_007055 [Choristoneura fumiferana]